MMCSSRSRDAVRDAPEGIAIRACRPDEYAAWRELHVGDPQQRDLYLAVLDGFFRDVYAPNGDLFFRQCRLACDENGTRNSDSPIRFLFAAGCGIMIPEKAIGRETK